MRRAAAVLASLVLLVASCSQSDGPEQGAGSSTSTTASTATTTSTTAELAEPTTTSAEGSELGLSVSGPVLEAAELVMGWLNGEPIDQPTYAAGFSQAFRDQVSYTDFTALLPEIASAGPWTVVEELDAQPLAVRFRIVGEAEGSAFDVSLAVEDTAEPVISTLFLAPATPPGATIAANVEQLQELGELRFLIADTTDGSCSTVEGVNEDDQAPLGSVFKLYVLAALIEAVDDGDISWDSDVVIRDELDAPPSGITQDDEPGSTLSVRTLAERMIEISDNTATDHLIDLVGREAVEQAVAASGHDDPSRLTPFLTVREFTIVKFGLTDEERAAYLAADSDTRRAFLEEQVVALELPSVAEVVQLTDPIDVETLEWFATPTDICEVLLQLIEDPEARSILARNPGVPDAAGRWEYVGYKGGSEPGLVAMSWWVEDDDGRSFVVFGSVANEDRLVDEAAVVTPMGFIRDLIE